MITKEGDSTAYLKSQAASESEFAFDAVFDEHASQIEVYNKSAKPYVEKVILGENVTIFAYGATGAGNEMTLNPETIFDDFLQGTWPYINRKNTHDVWKHQIRLHRCICRRRDHPASRG
jgi:hypothetical protein